MFPMPLPVTYTHTLRCAARYPPPPATTPHAPPTCLPATFFTNAYACYAQRTAHCHLPPYPYCTHCPAPACPTPCLPPYPTCATIQWLTTYTHYFCLCLYTDARIHCYGDHTPPHTPTHTGTQVHSQEACQ